MQAIALGTNAAYPGPDNACTGWLIVQGETRLLLDCGTGVLSRLQQFSPLEDVSAVVITHMHADHFLDLIPLRYAFKYGLNPIPKPLPIYLPPGGRATLDQMVSLLTEPGIDFFGEVFRLREYDPEHELEIGSLTLSFTPTNHYVPSWAVAVQGEGRLVYTADTGPSVEVGCLARGAALLISEATYLSVAEEGASLLRGHLTGREAGELADFARPRRLLLTHQWPNRDPKLALVQAQEMYAGAISLATAGKSYTV